MTLPSHKISPNIGIETRGRLLVTMITSVVGVRIHLNMKVTMALIK